LNPDLPPEEARPTQEKEQPNMAAETPASPAPSSPLLVRLKAETAHLHARIEEAVPLLRPELDREGYRSYLSRLLGYQRPLEARLARFAGAWADFGIDFAERSKAALLVDDLLALGATEARLAALPECRVLPASASLAEAWGCLYVIEGSTLGGQIILRALGPRLQLSPREGARFLAGYAERTGSCWKAFTLALAAFDAQGCDRDAMVRGASETFSTQLAWLASGAPVLR
jgi:heme oxygenase